MFVLVIFSAELRASVHVSLTIILIFWQVQLLISSLLPIPCFVFSIWVTLSNKPWLHLVPSKGFGEQNVLVAERLRKSWNDQEKLPHPLLSVVSSFHLQLADWVFISRMSSITFWRFKNSRDIVQSAQSFFQKQNREGTGASNLSNYESILVLFLPQVPQLSLCRWMGATSVVMPEYKHRHQSYTWIPKSWHNEWWCKRSWVGGAGVLIGASSSLRVNVIP